MTSDGMMKFTDFGLAGGWLIGIGLCVTTCADAGRTEGILRTNLDQRPLLPE